MLVWRSLPQHAAALTVQYICVHPGVGASRTPTACGCRQGAQAGARGSSEGSSGRDASGRPLGVPQVFAFDIDMDTDRVRFDVEAELRLDRLERIAGAHERFAAGDA